MADDDGESALDVMFTEPPRPPSPPSTAAIYTREVVSTKTRTDWTKIPIGLVGTHPLWGHYLWNAARAFATYLDQNSHIYQDRYVLELGAGGGLPGIVTALNGARNVVLTDYPDAELLANLQHNVEANVPDTLRDRVKLEGYIWGHHVQRLLDYLPSGQGASKIGFHLIILSDLIFNHSQHEALLNTCENALALSQINDCGNPPCVLVFYTHHRPHLAHRDMNFFQLAQQKGWTCEDVLQRKYPPMFPEDPGDEEMRSTVYGWRLTRTM